MAKSKNFWRAGVISLLVIFGHDFAAQADVAQQSIFSPALERSVSTLKSQIQTNISWAQQKYVFSNNGQGGVTVEPVDPSNNLPPVLYFYLARTLRDTRSVMIDSQKAIDAAITPVKNLAQKQSVSTQEANAFRNAYKQAIEKDTEICALLQKDLIDLFSNTTAQNGTSFLEAANDAITNTLNSTWKTTVGEAALQDTQSYLPFLNSYIQNCNANSQTMQKTLDDFNKNHPNSQSQDNVTPPPPPPSSLVQETLVQQSQTISCDPVTTAEMQRIYPNTTFVPGSGNQSEFEKQLRSDYDQQTLDSDFFKNIILWSKNELTPEGHQKLRLAINQMDIVNRSRPNFSFNEFITQHFKGFNTRNWAKLYNDFGTLVLVQELSEITDNGAGYPANSDKAATATNAMNDIIRELNNLKMGECSAKFSSAAQSNNSPTTVTCSPMSDAEINSRILDFDFEPLKSTTMSPNTRLALAKRVEDKLSGLQVAKDSSNGEKVLGLYLRISRPLAREISGTATDEDHKLIRLSSAQVSIMLDELSSLLTQKNISLNDKPNFWRGVYKDIGTQQYATTLQGYLSTQGLSTADTQPLIDHIQAIQLATNCPQSMVSKAPTFPDQMVPCGPVTKSEIQTIFPNHTITLQPPAKSPAEITNFEKQLIAMFNVKDDVKPTDTQFYKNVMDWANNRLSPQGHQLLRYTIEQFKILLGTYAADTFNFKTESEHFADEIGESSAKYWTEFYGDTMANTQAGAIGTLASTLENMNDKLSKPINPKNKIGPDAQGALLDIIGKLKALKLAPCNAPAPAPKPTVTPPATTPAKPTVTTPSAPKPVTPPATKSCPALTRVEILKALGRPVTSVSTPKPNQADSAYTQYLSAVNNTFNKRIIKKWSAYALIKEAVKHEPPLIPAEDNKELSQKSFKRCL